jgi:hypothetical protein
MTRFAPTLLAATSALALGLAACDDRGSRIDAPEPEPLAQLSTPVAELPYAEPAPVSWAPPSRGYQWAERAYGMQRAFYDVPPDYGFEYDGVEPMVWVSEDDWALYADPWDDGYRYYYYEPGAAYPYFVLDGYYGYGFDSTGVLIAVFDSGGRYLSQDVVYRMAPLAGRYYVRGRDLRNAGVQARRIRVDQRVWQDVAPRINRGADPWLRAARDDRAWRQWRERDGDRELQRFQREQRRREDIRRVAAVQPQVPLPAAPGLRDERRGDRFAEREARQTDRVAAQQQRQAFGRLQTQERGRQQGQLERQQAQLESRQAQTQRQAERQQQAQTERRQAMAQAQAERGRQAQMERQQAQAQRQAERQQARAQAEAERGRQAQVERQQQAQAERRQAMAQAQAERGRQAQMERQQQAQAQRQAERQQARAQAEAERGRQAQAERQQQAQAERRQAMAQAERGRQAQVERQQARAQAQTAEQQGRVAAAREQAQQAQAAQQQAQAAAARERGQGAKAGQASNDDPRGRRRQHQQQE